MPRTETARANGAAIRELRTQRGLSARQLASKIKRHEKTIRQLEWGKPNVHPSRVLMYQIANALKVDISEITFPADDAEDESAGAAA